MHRGFIYFTDQTKYDVITEVSQNELSEISSCYISTELSFYAHYYLLKNYTLKIYVFWVIGEISNFDDVILSNQSKNNIIKFERVVYQ